jgi:PKD repeat protein
MHPRRAPMAFLSMAVLLLLQAGCLKKDSATSPKAGPTANFSAAPLSGPSPLDVDFTDQSASGSSAITAVLWDFGDGTTSAAAVAHHLYGVAGTYSVSLTVTTADGTDTRTRVDYIVVGNGSGATPPNAVFSGTPTGGNAPLTVNFTDVSTAGSSPISGWSWTFGDGSTSTAQNPSHTYSGNGTYTVALAVTTSVGTDTETKPDYIVVSAAPVLPTADFSGTPTEGSVPLTVQFTDRSELGSATSFTSHTWNFGDGGTSTATSPSHTYALPGTYAVSLTVVTTVGSDSEAKNAYITVRPPPVRPTAAFSGTPLTGAAPLDVQFTDLSLPGTAPIRSWSWTFGDGGTSADPNPSHTYAAAGSYSVSLTVTTADGQNTSTKPDYVKPCATPAADFIATPATGFAPLNVKFNDRSTGAPNVFSWNFGDGGTSTQKDPSHVYAAPGTYTVSLTSGNACGMNTSTKTGFITVQDPCPDPRYSVISALWDTPKDGDGDHFYERRRLRWNADVTTGCSRSVFAQVFYRVTGTTDAWTLKGASACYTINGTATGDLGSMQISALPHDCYDFRIVLFECNGTTPVAVLEPGGDPDLTNQCFEP